MGRLCSPAPLLAQLDITLKDRPVPPAPPRKGRGDRAQVLTGQRRERGAQATSEVSLTRKLNFLSFSRNGAAATTPEAVNKEHGENTL